MITRLFCRRRSAGTGVDTDPVGRGSDRDFGLTNAAIATSGAEIVSRDGDVLTVLADGAQVQAIAQVADVAWIENWLLREKHNETSGGVIIGGPWLRRAAFVTLVAMTCGNILRPVPGKQANTHLICAGTGFLLENATARSD